MTDVKNPLTDRVQKMAAIIEAAKKVSKKVEEEEAKKAQGETGRPVQGS